jgi:hypothetical protein
MLPIFWVLLSVIRQAERGAAGISPLTSRRLPWSLRRRLRLLTERHFAMCVFLGEFLTINKAAAADQQRVYSCSATQPHQRGRRR